MKDELNEFDYCQIANLAESSNGGRVRLTQTKSKTSFFMVSISCCFVQLPLRKTAACILVVIELDLHNALFILSTSDAGTNTVYRHTPSCENIERKNN